MDYINIGITVVLVIFLVFILSFVGMALVSAFGIAHSVIDSIKDVYEKPWNEKLVNPSWEEDIEQMPASAMVLQTMEVQAGDGIMQ